MLKPLLALAVTSATLALAAPAFADGKIYVQLPDLSSYTGAKAEEFLHKVVLANVVSSNCTGYEVTEEEWSLLTDAADILAKQQLGLSTNDYDQSYYDPAFAELDKPGTCALEGPNVEVVIADLVHFGGSTTALPDQDAAYLEWRKMQDAWDAAEDAATSAAPSKTKTK